MTWGTDPVWTTRPDPVSGQNSIGVTTTRNRRLFNDLVYPLLSDAITYRLRYISFWAWVLNNVENPDKRTRAKYEKIFFLSNTAHKCPDDGHSTNGLVGAGRSIEGKYLADWYTEDTEQFDITEEAFSLTKYGGCGFDRYYQTLMQRFWIIYGETELTPAGRRVARAFDSAVDTSFSDFEAAVEAGCVSQELVQEFAADGCCCLLRTASKERDHLIRALLASFNQTDNATELDFRSTFDTELLLIDAWYPQKLSEPDEATISMDFSAELDDAETDLAEYFQQGLGARARASLLLFLKLSDRVGDAPPTDGWKTEQLIDIQRAWELFVNTHYFVVGCEALFKAWLHGLRQWEPISTSELLGNIFDAELYHATVKDIKARGLTVTVDDSGNDRLWQTLDAIYYQDWFEGTLSFEYEPPSDGGNTTALTWGQLLESDSDKRSSSPPPLDSAAERVLHDFLQSGPEADSDAARSQYLAGIATVLLGRVYQRGQQYISTEAFAPYRRWFNLIEASGSPSEFWYQTLENQTPVNNVIKEFMRDQIITKHQQITQQKIQDHPSKTPRYMLRRPDGRWEFKSIYRSSALSQSWSRMERLIDVLYELNLTTNANKSSFQPSALGQKLLGEFGIEQ